MKNKILISIAVLLVVLLIGIRYIFNGEFATFKTSIKRYEITQAEKFKREKESRFTTLSKGDKRIFQLFIEQFDETKCISEKDTSFTFLYLSGNLKYKSISFNYIECLNNKCYLDKKNEITNKQIEIKENDFKKTFSNDFAFWYPQLKDGKLVIKNKKPDFCPSYFSDVFETSINENAWNDFASFLLNYNTEKKEVDIKNKQIENEYLANLISTRNELKNNTLDYFDNKIAERKSQILYTENEQKTYNSTTLGLINYNLSVTTYKKELFQSIADDAFEEQWKNNSLSTGAMPYTYCYGGSNFCSDYGCSKIQVTTGYSGSDVIVTIKDENEKVVRHAYIKAGESFTFNVADGRYQVFFYSGNGWNPRKFMTTTTCGNLMGGFVTGENFSKDNYISLYSQAMNYELILQQNGNLRTEPSSLNEAFK